VRVRGVAGVAGADKEAGMESLNRANDGNLDDVPPPGDRDGAGGEAGRDPEQTRPSAVWVRPSPHLRTTKGGAGATAGATPKKTYRPSGSSRSRPAGKKADKAAY
jgi:hypothetical protein